MPNYSTQPNVNEGRGNIRSRRRRKPKKHKSQPHAKPHKPKAQNAPSWKNQPLFPGAMKTKGTFDQERTAATRQEFAPAEQEIAQEERNIPAWYGDYLKKLQGLQTQTTTQYEGLQSQAGSLAETVADATPEGQKAAEARTNIVKAIQGALLQQQGAAGNRNTEMAGIAGLRQNEKLSNVATAKSKLAKDKGDFKTEYTAKGKQTEFENTLAAKQFGLKVAEAKSKPKAESTYDKEFSKQAAKHGFSNHDWALLGPKGRAKRIAEADARSGKPPKSLRRIEREEQIKQAARHGYSVEDWNALPPSKRSAIIRGKGPKKDPKDKGTEFTWATPGQRGEASTKAAQTKSIAEDFKKKNQLRPQVAKTILKDPKAPNPVLVSAALDAVYDRHLSRETARRLQTAGFKATEIARALGTLTYTEWRRKAKRTGAALTGGN